MAVSFANIFMAEIETKLIQQGKIKPREWKRYIDDIFSRWDYDRKVLDRLIKRAIKYIISPYYQTHGRNIREPNHFSRYHSV